MKNVYKTAARFFKRRWHIIALVLISVLSFGLNFFAISKNGVGNTYYAAAIKSMTQSFKNFFFVSFDPAGMVSVDKPPLGLWIQALFVLIFGYHGWAMMLPQAIAGTGSCLLIYFLTKKYFGRAAGLLSALIFAVTPAVVVVSRNNTMDMQLIFFLLVAVWFFFKSIEKSKWRYLFIAAVFVGLAFNIKMLQAYTILPAFAIVYLIFSKQKFLKRLLAGLIATAIMAAVSFAWAIVVDLYPSSSRPYVDSSTNNTVLNLIIGHNGLERIYGQGAGMGGGIFRDGAGRNDGGTLPIMPGQRQYGGRTPPAIPWKGQYDGNTPPAQDEDNGSAQDNKSAQRQGNNNFRPAPGQNKGHAGTADSNGAGSTRDAGDNANGPRQQFDGGFTRNRPDGSGKVMGDNGRNGGNNGNDIGTASIIRLWNSSLYGQASWLLIFSLFGLAAFISKSSLKKPTLKLVVLTLWYIWLVTMFVFFSFAGFYHQYYLCMLAPQIAVLSGAGFVGMFRYFKYRKGIKQILLPVSLAATLAVELYHVWSYSALRAWLIPIMAVSGTAALILMAIYLLKPRRPMQALISIFTMVSLLAAPVYWSLTPVMYVPNATMPYAGPELAFRGGMGGGAVQNNTENPQSSLEKYLVKNYKPGSYLVVAQRASDVAQLIIDTGLPAVAYGGFLGSDNSLSVSKLKQLVAEGKVTYFLVSRFGGGRGNSELISYVEQNAVKVDASEYGGTSGFGIGSELYCFKTTGK
ncbi:glycosyltransferase family 39 protein [[Clostridium] cellulosi]|nr:MAG: dolichyl-phosphate-mannose--protein mannosyltransferase [[Clostridium] cellulosi]